MTIEEYVKRKIHPIEGDVVIICDELYKVVDSGIEPGRNDACDRCHLDGEVINGRDCIYSFIEGTYGSCAEFIREPYVLKRVRKKFKGI